MDECSRNFFTALELNVMPDIPERLPTQESGPPHRVFRRVVPIHDELTSISNELASQQQLRQRQTASISKKSIISVKTRPIVFASSVQITRGAHNILTRHSRRLIKRRIIIAAPLTSASSKLGEIGLVVRTLTDCERIDRLDIMSHARVS